MLLVLGKLTPSRRAGTHKRDSKDVQTYFCFVDERLPIETPKLALFCESL